MPGISHDFPPDQHADAAVVDNDKKNTRLEEGGNKRRSQGGVRVVETGPRGIHGGRGGGGGGGNTAVTGVGGGTVLLDGSYDKELSSIRGQVKEIDKTCR